MEKISLRQIIAALNKGGDLPSWISLQDVISVIKALKRGARNFTGSSFIAYSIIEESELVNILFVKSSRDATMLLRLLEEPGDE